MRIGLLVDGEAEFRSLGIFLSDVSTEDTLVGPLLANMQPCAPAGTIVRAATPKLKILKAKRIDRVVVLLDLENRRECPPTWVEELEGEFKRRAGQIGIDQMNVVLKVRTYENWLLADTAAFARLRRRFRLSRANINSIRPNKADNVAALTMLKRAAQGSSYDKVSDAVRITRVANPRTAARNSRSLRRLLRLVGDPSYASQSRRP